MAEVPHKGWPSEPQKLTSGKSRPVQLLLNILFLLLTSVFFVFVGLVVKYDGVNSKQVISSVYEASHYGPTVFPIIFALVVGRTIRSIALWRLERGARIGLLDLLIGSSSLTNMIVTQVELRIFGFGVISFLLLLIWSFSPLGGQASLRVVEFRDLPVINSTTLQYLDVPNGRYPQTLWFYDIDTANAPVDAAFLATLAGPLSSKLGPMDSWGNLKVPMIEFLPGYSPENKKDWIPVRESTSPPVYSSLVGLMVGNLPLLGNTSFNIEASYWTLNCPTLEKLTLTEMQEWESTRGNVSNETNPKYVGYLGKWGGIYSSPGAQDQGRCVGNNPDLPLRVLQYASYDTKNATAANCTIQTTYVELMVLCDGWNCTMDQMRHSQLSRPSPALTPFDLCSNVTQNYQFIYSFLGKFASSYSGGHNGRPSEIQYYFLQPGNPFNVFSGSTVDLSRISNITFSTSLAQLLNTYWVASLQPEALFLGHPTNYDNLSETYTSLYSDSTNSTTFLNKFSTANSNTSIVSTHFVYNRGWLVVIVISTIVMFLAALIKIVVDLKTWTPELMMNISTLTRTNSPYFANIPNGGSALSDAERARMLKSEMVRFGDIEVEDAASGELRIGALAEDGEKVQLFHKDRYYR